MTLPNLKTNNDEFDDKFKMFLVRHIKSVILLIFFICGMVWSIFQIPQIRQQQQQIDNLKLELKQIQEENSLILTYQQTIKTDLSVIIKTAEIERNSAIAEGLQKLKKNLDKIEENKKK